MKSWEFVADERDMSIPATFDITELDEAVKEVTQYLHDRVTSAINAFSGRPVLMLSGGIDSILIAAAVAHAGIDALAVTVARDGSRAATQELESASAVASHYELEHVIVGSGDREIADVAPQVVSKLSSTEPWEVLAGITLSMVDKVAGDRGATGALLSGAGADALFLGGEEIDTTEPGWLATWDERLRDKVARNFKRERFVPDFYERLLDTPERHIQVWQTHRAYDLALRLHPDVIRGPRRRVDKYLFRRAAEAAGVPHYLTNSPKDPMQVSSGGIDSLVFAAREHLADFYGDQTYSDPTKEALEFTVARLWLQHIQQSTS